MKASQSVSYYMGISYRTTYRPSDKKQLNNSSNLSNLNNIQVNSFDNFNQQQVKAIHSQKMKRKVEQIAKYRNPYLLRKQQQHLTKNRKLLKRNLKNHENLKQYFQITKIKTEGNQDQVIKIDNELPIQSKPSPIIIETKQKFCKQKSAIKDQNMSLFNHFPSPLFNELKSKCKTPLQKRGQYCRKSSFFFPSNKIKTQLDRSKSFTRPSSAIPKRKNFYESRVFNFDGTLQNHQIVIPQRPKTADSRQKHKCYHEHIEYLNYKAIAERSIRKKADKYRQRQIVIMPWGSSNEEKGSGNLLDLSFSTIRNQQNLQV